MTITDIYAELKGWQTAIGAVFGFCALLSGALLNAHLNRKRDDRIRADETKTVSAALYGEVLLLRKAAAILARVTARIYMVRGTRRTTMKYDKDYQQTYQLPEATFYKALASKVGLLPPNVALSLTAFHQQCYEANRGVELLLDNPQRGFVYAPDVVLRPARMAVQDVLPALQHIERLLGIESLTPGEINLGDTDLVIEMLDENERAAREEHP